MKVLVTGASGRIGRAVFARLAREHQVTGLDVLASPTAGVVGDVGDATLLRRALRGMHAVVHCAALHAPHVGKRPDSEFQRVNVDATRTLVDAAAACGVARIVYTSTTALYGTAGRQAVEAAWVDETLAPEPQTVYHRSKLAAEAVLAQAAAQGGPSVRLLRMGRCFPEAAPLMAAYRLHRGIDARDVADAHALALGGMNTGMNTGVDTGMGAATGTACELYVVCAATPFKRSDAPLLGHDAAAVIRARAPGLAAAFAARGWPLPRRIDRVYDSARAQAAWAWRLRFGVAEVLAQLDRGAPEVLPHPVNSTLDCTA